jgi:hypothetical protein
LLRKSKTKDMYSNSAIGLFQEKNPFPQILYTFLNKSELFFKTILFHHRISESEALLKISFQCCPSTGAESQFQGRERGRELRTSGLDENSGHQTQAAYFVCTRLPSVQSNGSPLHPRETLFACVTKFRLQTLVPRYLDLEPTLGLFTRNLNGCCEVP